MLDVCVDYVGRDGTADMDEIARRFATQASVPLVLDSTEPQVLEAALQHIGGRAILNSANLEDGELPGSRMDRVFSLAREYGAAVICLLIDERGQARDVEWKMEVAHRIHQIATERYGLSASDLIFDALTFPLSTGDDDLRRDGAGDDRGHPAHQGRDPRRQHRARRLQRVVRPLAGRPPRPQLGVPARVRGGRPRRRHRARRPHHAAQPDPRGAARRSPSISSTTAAPPGYDPLTKLLDVFADVQHVATEKEDRSGWPVEERLKARIIDGDRDGLVRRPRRRPGHRLDAARPRERRAARRHAHRGRAVRLGPDAAAVRAAVGRDDEGRRRPPRAAHGEGGGPDVEGAPRAGHREGRRARHRQEPGRHHPHQQRLRGVQPRHQGADRRHGGQGQGGRRRRHRHERPAREEHAHHARQPPGAERAGPGRRAGAPRRRRPHPHLRREGPARDLRGPAVLRPRRLRGPPHDGPAHDDQARRRRRPRLRPRADGAGAAQAGLRARRRGRSRHHPGAVAVGRHRQPRVRAAVHRLAHRQGPSRSTRSSST